MKKIVIIVLATAVFGCAKKITPAGSGTSSSGTGGGKVITGNAPSSSTGSTGTAAATPAATQAEGTGAKTPATPTTPATTAAPEVQGQTTYNAKCGKCHGLKVVADYNANRWASIMAVMGPKAHLNDVETVNVMAYVKANAKK